MAHDYVVPMFIPVVSLWPIMEPYGLLPELCRTIEVWVAAISFCRVKEVILGLQWDTTCAICLLPWGQRAELAAFETDGRIYVNCKTIMPPHDADSVINALRGFQSRWSWAGQTCRSYTTDDSSSDQSDTEVSDDHSMEALLPTCGLVAGYYA